MNYFDKELNDLLFEIEESFISVQGRIERFINLDNNLKLKNINVFKGMINYDCNDIIFYTRALRDKLENE